MKRISIRHVVFTREQLIGLVKILEEFPAILGVDFTYVPDTMEPLRVDYLWEDDS